LFRAPVWSELSAAVERFSFLARYTDVRVPEYWNDIDEDGRPRPRFKFESHWHSFVRDVAFAAWPPVGCDFLEFRMRTPVEDEAAAVASGAKVKKPSRARYWEADHINQKPDTCFWEKLQVVEWWVNPADGTQTALESKRPENPRVVAQ